MPSRTLATTAAVAAALLSSATANACITTQNVYARWPAEVVEAIASAKEVRLSRQWWGTGQPKRGKEPRAVSLKNAARADALAALELVPSSPQSPTQRPMARLGFPTTAYRLQLVSADPNRKPETVTICYDCGQAEIAIAKVGANRYGVYVSGAAKLDALLAKFGGPPGALTPDERSEIAAVQKAAAAKRAAEKAEADDPRAIEMIPKSTPGAPIPQATTGPIPAGSGPQPQIVAGAATRCGNGHPGW